MRREARNAGAALFTRVACPPPNISECSCSGLGVLYGNSWGNPAATHLHRAMPLHFHDLSVIGLYLDKQTAAWPLRERSTLVQYPR